MKSLIWKHRKKPRGASCVVILTAELSPSPRQLGVNIGALFFSDTFRPFAEMKMLPVVYIVSSRVSAPFHEMPHAAHISMSPVSEAKSVFKGTALFEYAMKVEV